LEFHGGSVSVFPKIKKWTVEAMRKKRVQLSGLHQTFSSSDVEACHSCSENHGKLAPKFNPSASIGKRR